jgi:hypothetical protein
MLARMADEPIDNAPRVGLTISVRSRTDVVIMDPERFLAAARAAYHELYPGAGEPEITDVVEAVHIMLDRYGSLGSDDPAVAAGGSTRSVMHGGFGHLPGDRVHGRADGLSPAGEIAQIVIGEPPLQDYGCFGPADKFALPPEDFVPLPDNFATRPAREP